MGGGLLRDDATHCLVDTTTNILGVESRTSFDMFGQGVPSKSYKLPAAWLKEGSAVINVSTFKNVDEEDVLKVSNWTLGHYRCGMFFRPLDLRMTCGPALLTAPKRPCTERNSRPDPELLSFCEGICLPLNMCMACGPAPLTAPKRAPRVNAGLGLLGHH